MDGGFLVWSRVDAVTAHISSGRVVLSCCVSRVVQHVG